MKGIISFEKYKEISDVKKFSFRVKGVRVSDKDSPRGFYIYPCIVLYEKEMGVPLLVTNYSKWIIDLQEDEKKENETLRKRANNVCKFLNYILWETETRSINEVTINVIRDYLIWIKNGEGKQIGVDTWEKNKNDVLNFLIRVYEENKNQGPFGYKASDLHILRKERTPDNKRTIYYDMKVGLGVRRPKGRDRKKNRYISMEMFEVLCKFADRYDFPLEIMMMLGCYAGVREGEIVNLSQKSITFPDYNQDDIEIDLFHEAIFFSNWKGKTEPGKIKRPRLQVMYPVFNEIFEEKYMEYVKYLEDKGLWTGRSDTPLFFNQWGEPLTVYSYQSRLKTFFYRYFLPYLEKECQMTGDWDLIGPYIYAYKKDYPGAHMLRHCFTMYLFKKLHLDPKEVARWRGDSSDESMNKYVTIYSDMVDLYVKNTYAFQNWLFERIMKDEE